MNSYTHSLDIIGNPAVNVLGKVIIMRPEHLVGIFVSLLIRES